jgi:hypothetical protein
VLTAILGPAKISLALNKKSAQKQKRTPNNGFSQAVVPSRKPTLKTNKRNNKIFKLRLQLCPIGRAVLICNSVKLLGK